MITETWDERTDVVDEGGLQAWPKKSMICPGQTVGVDMWDLKFGQIRLKSAGGEVKSRLNGTERKPREEKVILHNFIDDLVVPDFKNVCKMIPSVYASS